MIWFACAQCGKRHGRPENAIGSVLFCDCGHGNRVPWESTLPAPLVEEEPETLSTPQPPPLPRIEPVPVGEERLPAARPARRARGRRRDPAFCFNHEELPSTAICDGCEEHFCNHCVARLGARTLCGPCKNYHFRQLARPPRVSGLALASVIIALLCAGLAPFLLLVLIAGGAVNNPAVALAVVVLPQLVAGLLAAGALYQTATNPRLGGQSLAITALVTAGTVTLLTGALTMMHFVPWV
jgi:hypothetical protein